MNQVTLGELIAFLEELPEDGVVEMGLTNAHSYRGFYHQLAFEQAGITTIGEMLTEARFADQTEYYGWRGGCYLMTSNTPVWVAEEGRCGLVLSRDILEQWRGEVE